ncbi:MAG: ribosome maturation factor RimP [Chromatiales bacterium]|nr:ribosome maturation factor RimP [Chromatiales bacterium]
MAHFLFAEAWLIRASERLAGLLEPVVTGLGYEWVGAEQAAHGGGGLLRVYIDSPNGVTVDDCARVSEQVSAVLDVEDPIVGAYTLEVSSPGLERPLFALSDFHRFAGRPARVVLNEKLDGRKRFSGDLVGVDGEHVVIDSEQGQIALPYALIESAHLTIVDGGVRRG